MERVAGIIESSHAEDDDKVESSEFFLFVLNSSSTLTSFSRFYDSSFERLLLSCDKWGWLVVVMRNRLKLLELNKLQIYIVN